MSLNYNTSREQIRLTEYGRSIQELVKNIQSVEDEETRIRMANTIFQIILNQNPAIKELENYEQKLWDHICMISDYRLTPPEGFHKPIPQAEQLPPEKIPYKEPLTRYRFYGRNLIDMIQVAVQMQDNEMKTLYINYLASFMVNSSNSWNDEKLTLEQVAGHLSDLSNGQLQLSPETIEIHREKWVKRPPMAPKGQASNNNRRKKFKRRS